MAAPTLEELTNTVFAILRDDVLTPDESFSPSSNLVEAGLDSLSMTQVLLAIEESTGLWVDESELTPENLENTRTLAALVHGQLSQT
jgi:acyl carrier protein